MPVPRIVRQWNKAGLNRVTTHIAPWTPLLSACAFSLRATQLRVTTPRATHNRGAPPESLAALLLLTRVVSFRRSGPLLRVHGHVPVAQFLPGRRAGQAGRVQASG